MRRIADRADDRSGPHFGSVLEQHARRRDGLGARRQANLDAAGRQSLVSIFSQLLGELGQDPIPALNDGDLEVAATQRRIKPQRFGQQVEDFTRHLDAAESAAEHGERHQLPPLVGIRLDLGPFEPTDEMVPQHEPVAQRFESERLRGRAGQNVGVDDHATGDHQVIVLLPRDPPADQLVFDLLHREVEG